MLVTLPFPIIEITFGLEPQVLWTLNWMYAWFFCEWWCPMVFFGGDIVGVKHSLQLVTKFARAIFYGFKLLICLGENIVE